jgi:hypothetical protein
MTSLKPETIYGVVPPTTPLRQVVILKVDFAGIKEIPDSRKSDTDLESIKERFQKILSIDTLNSLSKAIGLQREGERLYCDAQIFSDVRPVFGKDVSQDPTAAVITHTLKIGYHDGRGHQEFFLVLDQEDLGNLQEVIERASAKSETLDRLLHRLELPRLGI